MALMLVELLVEVMLYFALVGRTAGRSDVVWRSCW